MAPILLTPGILQSRAASPGNSSCPTLDWSQTSMTASPGHNDGLPTLVQLSQQAALAGGRQGPAPGSLDRVLRDLSWVSIACTTQAKATAPTSAVGTT